MSLLAQLGLLEELIGVAYCVNRVGYLHGGHIADDLEVVSVDRRKLDGALVVDLSGTEDRKVRLGYLFDPVEGMVTERRGPAETTAIGRVE